MRGRRTIDGMDLGPSEVIVILIVVMLLFGAKKLPDLARGTGQALRIFKEETRGIGAPDRSTPSAAPVTPSEAPVTPSEAPGSRDTTQGEGPEPPR